MFGFFLIKIANCGVLRFYSTFSAQVLIFINATCFKSVQGRLAGDPVSADVATVLILMGKVVYFNFWKIS